MGDGVRAVRCWPRAAHPGADCVRRDGGADVLAHASANGEPNCGSHAITDGFGMLSVLPIMNRRLIHR